YVFLEIPSDAFESRVGRRRTLAYLGSVMLWPGEPAIQSRWQQAALAILDRKLLDRLPANKELSVTAGVFRTFVDGLAVAAVELPRVQVRYAACLQAGRVLGDWLDSNQQAGCGVRVLGRGLTGLDRMTLNQAKLHNARKKKKFGNPAGKEGIDSLNKRWTAF